MLICHVYHILSGAFTSPQLEFVSLSVMKLKDSPIWALLGLDAGLEQ